MFGTKKPKKGYISSPVSGQTIPLEETGDEVFAEKLVGDGIAVMPEEGAFYAPCDGTVQSVAKTSHAYSITSDDGLDVLVHIGIDTVEMNGEGFDAKVKDGEKVKRGQLICNADIELIKSRGFSTVTPVVISNIDDVSFIDRREGNIKSGDEIINYVL